MKNINCLSKVYFDGNNTQYLLWHSLKLLSAGISSHSFKLSQRGLQFPGHLRYRQSQCHISPRSSSACGRGGRRSWNRRRRGGGPVQQHLKILVISSVQSNSVGLQWEWPSVTAPPHVLNFSMGMSKAFWQESACAAKASLISI